MLARFDYPPSDVSLALGVHPHRDLPSCHQPNGYRPRLDKMVSTGDPHLRGTHEQWLVNTRLNPVPVVIAGW